MLVSLEKIEAQQYEPVWTGSTWRNFDWTPPPAQLPDYSRLHPPAPRKDGVLVKRGYRLRNRRQRPTVLSVVSDVPKSAMEIAVLLGVKSHEATSRLMPYVSRGEIVQTYARVGWKKQLVAQYSLRKTGGCA